MPTWLEGIQKKIQSAGESLEDLGKRAGRAIDEAAAPAVEKLNTKAYQETKEAKASMDSKAKRRSDIEKRGRMR